jgi:hypothetical protein
MGTHRLFLGACIALLALPTFGQSSATHAPPNTENVKRIEGTVARVDRDEFLLTVKGGTTETYQLSPSVQITQARPGTMADLSRGKFVGCTTVENQDGKLTATECHVFPESMRGVGEGHTAMPAPITSMTNGTITVVNGDVKTPPGNGRNVVIQITYRGGANELTVSPLTEITVIKAGDVSALKPGVKVRGISQEAVDGTGVVQTLTVMTAGTSKHNASANK